MKIFVLYLIRQNIALNYTNLLGKLWGGKNLGLSSKEYYQLDVRNTVNAIRKIHEDILEGSDIIMVKPATFYLDIIKEAKEKINVPIAAYQVSGEYYMLKMASLNEIFNYKNVVVESLNCIKRAGASLIFFIFYRRSLRMVKRLNLIFEFYKINTLY